jgi:hypothetical protein
VIDPRVKPEDDGVKGSEMAAPEVFAAMSKTRKAILAWLLSAAR